MNLVLMSFLLWTLRKTTEQSHLLESTSGEVHKWLQGKGCLCWMFSLLRMPNTHKHSGCQTRSPGGGGGCLSFSFTLLLLFPSSPRSQCLRADSLLTQVYKYHFLNHLEFSLVAPYLRLNVSIKPDPAKELISDKFTSHISETAKPMTYMMRL